MGTEDERMGRKDNHNTTRYEISDRTSHEQE